MYCSPLNVVYQLFLEKRDDMPFTSFTVGSVVKADGETPVVLNSQSIAEADALFSRCGRDMVSFAEKGCFVRHRVK